MTAGSVETWFDDAGRSGAPSFNFGKVGDFVKGEVVDQFEIPYVKYENRKAGTQEIDSKTGQPIFQLVIVLQTELRNWEGVKNVPTDSDDKPKPGSEDDGKRAIYVRKYTNIHGAVGAMLRDASTKAGHKVRLENGGELGIQFFKETDTGKGNPLKEFRGKYTPPAAPPAGDAYFEDKPAASGAPSASNPKVTEVTDEPPF